MITIFIGHIYGYNVLHNIYKRTSSEDKHNIYWITQTMLMGLLAHLLFIIGQLFFPSMIGFSTEISTYLYLFLLTFTVGQWMIPLFSNITVQKDMALLRNIFTLLWLHILLEGLFANSSFFIDLFLAYYIGKELLRWELPLSTTNPMLWMLHLSLFLDTCIFWTFRVGKSY